MRRWIEWAAALYPARWRDEYGEEFRELLENVQPNYRTLGNVLRGAIAMQIVKGTNWIKWIAATAALGAALSAALSFIVQPAKYVSSATMEVRPLPDPVRPPLPEAFAQRAASHLNQEEQEILSRTTLMGIITDPALDLYKEERRQMPMEDVIERMRTDIHLHLTQAESRGAPHAILFSLSFDYPDPYKAKAVTAALVTKFREQNLQVNRTQAHSYQVFWDEMRQTGDATAAPPPPPMGDDLTVVSQPSLPRQTDQSRAAFIASGLAAGALLGVLLALARRRRRGVWMLAGAAVAGLLVAGPLAFLAPNRYTSTVVMRLAPPQIMADPLAMPRTVTAPEFLRKLEPEILNRENLETIIQLPGLDLYPDQRRRQPLEQIAEKMRRDLHVGAASMPGIAGDSSAFSIAFTYTDPRKARQVVRKLTSQLIDWYVTQQRAKALDESVTQQRIEEHKAGETLEILDPPSLPETPIAPDRLAIAATGMALGLLAGILALRRLPVRMPAAR